MTMLVVTEWSVQTPPAWDGWWAVSATVLVLAIVATLVSVARSRLTAPVKIVWAAACLLLSLVAVPAWWLSKFERRGTRSSIGSGRVAGRG